MQFSALLDKWRNICTLGICWFSFRWHLLAGWTWLANLRRHIENRRTNFEGFFFSQLLCTSLQTPTNAMSVSLQYDKVASVPESWVRWRSNFQSGSRVLKKVLWTFSYQYLWPTMWSHAENWLKTIEFWKLLNSLYNLGSRAQKSPKIPQKKTDHSSKNCLG